MFRHFARRFFASSIRFSDNSILLSIILYFTKQNLSEKQGTGLSPALLNRLGETRHEWIYILIGNPPTLLYPCCASNVAMDFGFQPVAFCVGILTLIFALRGVSALSI